MGILGDLLNWFKTNLDEKAIATAVILTVLGSLGLVFRKAVRAAILHLWSLLKKNEPPIAKSSELASSYDLSREEEELLVWTHESADPHLFKIGHGKAGGYYVQVRSMSLGFALDADGLPLEQDGRWIRNREECETYLDAVERLESKGLIDETGTSGNLYKLTADGRQIAKEIQRALRDDGITEDMAALLTALSENKGVAKILKPRDNYPKQVTVETQYFGNSNKDVANRFVYAANEAERLGYMTTRATGRGTFGPVVVMDLTPEGEAKVGFLKAKSAKH